MASDRTSDDDSLLPTGSVDARFTLAAERTLLAWLRTALGLIAAGVAVMHVQALGSPTARSLLGVALIVLGALASLTGTWRWRQVTHALRSGSPMPGPAAIWVLGIAIAVLGLAFAFFP